MALIYLLRHGETVANRDGRLQGRSDSPLTLKGVAQMRAIAALLADEIADPSRFAVVSSPLGRARRSAAIVCQALGLDTKTVSCDPRLTEYSFGQWEGLLVAEVEAAAPGAWAQREADRWSFAPPGGESYAMVAGRVGDWLGEQAPGGRLIVVCHGAVSRVLRGLYASLPPAQSVKLTQDQTNLYRLSAGRIETLRARPDPGGWSL
jgi:probable phosphoglycerate mutase